MSDLVLRRPETSATIFMLKSLDGGRNPIGRRTESDWTANAIRLDGGRNPIGRRTQSDWTANGIRSDGGRNPIGQRTQTVDLRRCNFRGCTCLKCTNQAVVHQPSSSANSSVGAVGTTAPPKVHQPSKNIIGHGEKPCPICVYTPS